MTHEEVLNELKEVRAINTSRKEDKYTVDSFVKISNESLDKAIEALENQKSIIEELENIKEKLIEECVYLTFCYKINRIVNKRISELKEGKYK